jgi:hypothetical protein
MVIDRTQVLKYRYNVLYSYGLQGGEVQAAQDPPLYS